jgi:hypothetical protein
MNQAQKHSRQDLPVLLWAVFPPVMLLVLIFLAYANPEIFQLMMAKDDEGGIVEHATVLVLLPGIAAGFAVFFYHRKDLPHPWLGWWVLMWTLACIFFAGEEISWGQWFFEWKSPEVFKQLNSQEETNLHNMTPWLFQKPQALVEIWIILGGLVLPLWRRYKKNIWILPDQTWNYWLWPTYVCMPAAGFALLLRFIKPVFNAAPLFQLERLGSGELREYYIALFLGLYLLSFWFRIRRLQVKDL